jgi:PAS domain S-box-containing protein
MDLGPDLVALRRALRDLVALSAIPAVWVGKKPSTIAAELAELVATSLRLDFVFVRLHDPSGNAAVEITRGKACSTVTEWLHHHLTEGGRLSRKQIIPSTDNDTREGRGIVLPVGMNAERGLLAAWSGRPDFPEEIDQLLLSVATNHAATAYQMARLLEDHRQAEAALHDSERLLRKARDELETTVAERTAELRRSEAHLAEAQRLSHTGAVTYNGTAILFASEETYRIWGFDPAQGLPPREVVFQRIHPGDRDWLNAEVRRAVGEKRRYSIAYRILLPDGTVKHLETIGQPVFSASGKLVEIFATQTDVTERKRAEEALRESEAQFRDYAESASDWFWEIDPDYKFTMLTDNAFGSTAADRIGTACWDRALDLETESEKWRLLLSTLDARRPFRDFVYRGLGGKGSPMYVKASGKPVFDGNGEFCGYRGAGTDVTTHMHAQEEHERLRQLESDLARMNRLSMMGELAASLAHEIAQPISAASNNARAAMHFLDRSPPDLGQVREALACVVGDDDRAGEILDRIREQVKKAPPRKERVDLNQAVTDVIVLRKAQSAEMGSRSKPTLRKNCLTFRRIVSKCNRSF